jgi:caffeoyl-CoA O-methyltransferase
VSRKTIEIDEKLHGYLLDVSVREPEIMRTLRRVTESHVHAAMQVSPEQGQFMAFLVRLTGARNCLELGVFTGYSALAVALALPRDGHITACDVNEEWTRTAREFWEEAGISHKIDLHLAPALDTLKELQAAGKEGSFDFAFIDADKVNYWAYFEGCLELVRKGGLIVIDNTLWSGQVIDPGKQDEDTVAIRDFNRRLHRDSRVDISLLPIGDGLSLARKR